MSALASSQRSSQTGKKACGTRRQSRVSNFNEALNEVSQVLRSACREMGNLQNNIRGQITRTLSNESNQATDSVSSRQTAPADQSQQSSPDTPSAVSNQRIRGHDQRMDQTAFEVISLFGVKQTSS